MTGNDPHGRRCCDLTGSTRLGVLLALMASPFRGIAAIASSILAVLLALPSMTTPLGGVVAIVCGSPSCRGKIALLIMLLLLTSSFTWATIAAAACKHYYGRERPRACLRRHIPTGFFRTTPWARVRFGAALILIIFGMRVASHTHTHINNISISFSITRSSLTLI